MKPKTPEETDSPDDLVLADSPLRTVLSRAQSCTLELLVAACLRSGSDQEAGLLLAVLTARDVWSLMDVFDEVVSTPKMLSSYIRYMRSGITGRRSLGTRPKRLVQARLNSWAPEVLLRDHGTFAPSLGEVIRLVHPVPKDRCHARIFAYLTGNSLEPPPILRILSGATGSPTRARPQGPTPNPSGSGRCPTIERRGSGNSRQGPHRHARTT